MDFSFIIIFLFKCFYCYLKKCKWPMNAVFPGGSNQLCYRRPQKTSLSAVHFLHKQIIRDRPARRMPPCGKMRVSSESPLSHTVWRLRTPQRHIVVMHPCCLSVSCRWNTWRMRREDLRLSWRSSGSRRTTTGRLSILWSSWRTSWSSRSKAWNPTRTNCSLSCRRSRMRWMIPRKGQEITGGLILPNMLIVARKLVTSSV